MVLTQKIVDNLSCEADCKKLTVFDMGCKNLVLEVSNTGRKSYYFRYQDSRGVTRQPKLSDANSITLKQARSLADSYRTKLSMGEDPLEQKAALKLVPTFAQFIDEQYLPHIKTYKRSGSTITLEPSNSTMQPMVFSAADVAVFGKVVTVMRRL